MVGEPAHHDFRVRVDSRIRWKIPKVNKTKVNKTETFVNGEDMCMEQEEETNRVS